MDFQKILWVRIDKQEAADEVKQFISELKEQFPGNILVRLYAVDTQTAADMSSQSRLSESAVPLLKEKYGAENVKITKDRIYPDDEFGLRLESLIAIERIADSLEAIESHLAQNQNKK